MRHFRLSFVASTIVLCGLLSGPFTPRPVAATDIAQRAEIAGAVVDGAGNPVQGVAARVMSARTRVGNTPHCPTCWADCGKTAISDSAGRFAIKSLDPQLVFCVLVVAKGYEPEVVHLIDPQKDEPLKVALKSRRALPKDTRQILSGQVIDSHGKPIAAALVEPFGCKDGDKRWWGEMSDADPLAVTDVRGRFDIIANHPLDGIDLKVTARAMAEKNFALVPTAKTDNRLIITEGATVRGRIVDHGRPAAGVIVRLAKPERWRETLVGPYDIDTDGHGGFVFSNVPPNQDYYVYGVMSSDGTRGGTSALQIHVGADGSETKVGELAIEGATVRGRVVDHGRPVAAVKIRLEQVDYEIMPRIGTLDATTDGRGEYLVANLPPGRDYYVYGTMESLLDRGGISARKIHAGADGSDNIADLAIEPACRISGRIVLSDGKSLPAHTRIRVDRENVADSQVVDAEPSGAFMIRGIPSGSVGFSAQIDGYRLSKKNVSFAPRNGSDLRGLVEKNIDGLLVLFEPGEPKSGNYASATNDERRKINRTEERIRLQPLAGAAAVAGGYRNVEDLIVERPLHASKPLPKIELPPPLPKPVSADANVPKRVIVGRVVDQAGKPIADADVWHQVRRNADPGEFTVHAKSGSEGRFKLEFPIQWLPKNPTGPDMPTVVSAHAPGYAVAAGDATSQVIPDLKDPNSKQPTPLEIQLGPECDAEFTVLTPDGKPLAGARVGPPTDLWPPEFVAKTCGITDEHGRTRVAGMVTDGIERVVVESANYGTQVFLLRCSREIKVALQLVPVGRIEGQIVAAQPELFRGMSVSITTRQRKIASKQKDIVRCEGQAVLHVDPDGRFVVPAIAAGQVFMLDARIADERLPVRPRVIEENQVEVVAGQTARIDIPLEMLVKVHGLVRVKETGKPVAGATIVVHSDHFSLREKAVSDGSGRYSASVLLGDVRVEVIKDPSQDVRQSQDSRQSVYNVPNDATEFELPVVEVEKCKNVAGLLLDKDGKPAPTSSIQAFAGEKMYFVIAWEQGKFEFRDVPEGAVFDRFRIGSTGPNAHQVPFTIQSKDPLVLRLK